MMLRRHSPAIKSVGAVQANPLRVQASARLVTTLPACLRLAGFVQELRRQRRIQAHDVLVPASRAASACGHRKAGGGIGFARRDDRAAMAARHKRFCMS